jgi:hypothetical protein
MSMEEVLHVRKKPRNSGTKVKLRPANSVWFHWATKVRFGKKALKDGTDGTDPEPMIWAPAATPPPANATKMSTLAVPEPRL